MISNRWYNLIRFSFNHNNNTVNLLQLGNKNYIGYTDAWGSGYSWGGDLDGLRNNIDVRQKCSLSTNCNDNDFQFHVWGDDNVVKFANQTAHHMQQTIDISKGFENIFEVIRILLKQRLLKI